MQTIINKTIYIFILYLERSSVDGINLNDVLMMC